MYAANLIRPYTDTEIPLCAALRPTWKRLQFSLHVGAASEGILGCNADDLLTCGRFDVPAFKVSSHVVLQVCDVETRRGAVGGYRKGRGCHPRSSPIASCWIATATQIGKLHKLCSLCQPINATQIPLRAGRHPLAKQAVTKVSFSYRPT